MENDFMVNFKGRYLKKNNNPRDPFAGCCYLDLVLNIIAASSTEKTTTTTTKIQTKPKKKKNPEKNPPKMPQKQEKKKKKEKNLLLRIAFWRHSSMGYYFTYIFNSLNSY